MRGHSDVGERALVEESISSRSVVRDSPLSPSEPSILDALSAETAGMAGKRHVLTNDVLTSLQVCRHRGMYVFSHTPEERKRDFKPPSAFAAGNTLDGHSFEEYCWGHKSDGLFDKLNDKLGTSLRERVTFEADVAPLELSVDGLKDYLFQVQRDHRSAILREIPLQGSNTLTEGDPVTASIRIDLAIWDGSCWVIGDIKRSENVLTSHANQIHFYGRVWRSLLRDCPLSPRGFVLSCAPGFPFMHKGDGPQKWKAFQNSVVTVFDLGLMEHTFAGNYYWLMSAWDPPKEGYPRFLQRSCPECPLQRDCYPRFLDQGHVSLLPLESAQVQTLIARRILTLEDFEAALDDGRLEDFHMGYDWLRELWRTRAVLARRYGGFSMWRSRPGWGRVWFGKAYREGLSLRGEWVLEDGNRMTPRPATHRLPDVIICLDAVEREQLFKLLRREGYTLKDINQVEWLQLVDEVMRDVRMPLPSYSLPDLAAYLGALEHTENWRGLLELLGNAPAREVEPLSALQHIWRGLLYLEEVFHG